MDMKDYLNSSARTAPVLPEGETFTVTPEMEAELEDIGLSLLEVAERADKLKRAMFYRPLEQYSAAPEAGDPIDDLRQGEMDLVHALLGIISEAGELGGPVLNHALRGRAIDRVNMVEETGDLLWYQAMLLRAVGGNFDQATDANISKLFKRYPDAFDGDKAINRDTVVERADLEQKINQ